jgi:5-methylcytosine-specific restriction endonuclease McrA
MSNSAHVPAALRRAVFLRARETCEYCKLQQAYTAATFEVDHILPRVAGGESILENCCLACPKEQAVVIIIRAECQAALM